MISIDKTKITKPAVLSEKVIQEKLLKIIADDFPGESIKNLYKHDKVTQALNKLYHNKCAYCEGIANNEQFSARIDHYRPKNKIGNEKRSKKYYVPNHKGYFWLGYEWTNLLPTCEKCNSQKSNKFPLKAGSPRISSDLEKEGFMKNDVFVFEKFKITELETEQRLLLNPEIDAIENHLFFLFTGEIAGLTDEGRETIAVYGLNRDELKTKRKKILDSLLDQIIEEIVENDEEQSIQKSLMKLFKKEMNTSAKKEYSRFRYFIYEYFDFFVLDRLKDLGFERHADLVNDYFQAYKTKNRT